MEAIEKIQKPVNGQLIIDVPAEWEGKEVEITIKAHNTKLVSEMTVAERLELLKKFEGTARYPDTPIDKYEVYEQ